jgi:hypothetical protein
MTASVARLDTPFLPGPTARVLRNGKVAEIPVCRGCARPMDSFALPHDSAACLTRHTEPRYRMEDEVARNRPPALYPGGDLPPGKPSWVGPIEPALPHVRLFAFVGDLSGCGVWAEVGLEDRAFRAFPRFRPLRMVDEQGELLKPVHDHHSE